jgi:type IV fimbrial biogenesis protein FimT
MKQRQTGLTLVELMVTLAAAIILLSVGMPFFGGIIANNRAVADANGFLSSFKLARSEAVKRASFVVVAPTSVSAGWESGWRVFEESQAPGDGNFGTRQGAEPILRTWDAIDVTVGLNPASPAFVAFDSTGQSTETSTRTITITPLETSVPRSRCLQISGSGQIRMRSFRPDAPFNETCP